MHVHRLPTYRFSLTQLADECFVAIKCQLPERQCHYVKSLNFEKNDYRLTSELRLNDP